DTSITKHPRRLADEGGARGATALRCGKPQPQPPDNGGEPSGLWARFSRRRSSPRSGGSSQVPKVAFPAPATLWTSVGPATLLHQRFAIFGLAASMPAAASTVNLRPSSFVLHRSSRRQRNVGPPLFPGARLHI